MGTEGRPSVAQQSSTVVQGIVDVAAPGRWLPRSGLAGAASGARAAGPGTWDKGVDTWADFFTIGLASSPAAGPDDERAAR